MTAGGAPADARVTAAVWTTTPWTLPANRALAVNSAIDYVVVRSVTSPLSLLLTRSPYLHQPYPDTCLDTYLPTLA